MPGSSEGDLDYREFDPLERPEIGVLVDGEWHPGELRAWARRPSGWWAHVYYSRHTVHGRLRFPDCVPQHRVRTM